MATVAEKIESHVAAQIETLRDDLENLDDIGAIRFAQGQIAALRGLAAVLERLRRPKGRRPTTETEDSE